MQNQLIEAIDKIDSAAATAEIEVLESLIDVYDKSLMILQEENCGDIYAYAVFQETETPKVEGPEDVHVFGQKGEHILKRILLIIPRLIKKCYLAIKKLFTKNKVDAKDMTTDTKEIKSAGEKTIPKPLTKEQREVVAKAVKEKPPKQTTPKEDVKVPDSATIEAEHEESMKRIKEHRDAFEKFQKSSGEYLEKVTELLSQQQAYRADLQSLSDTIEKVHQKNPELIESLAEALDAPPEKERIKLKDCVFYFVGTKFFVNFNPSTDDVKLHSSIPNVSALQDLRDFEMPDSTIFPKRLDGHIARINDNLDWYYDKWEADYEELQRFSREKFTCKYSDFEMMFENMETSIKERFDAVDHMLDVLQNNTLKYLDKCAEYFASKDEAEITAAEKVTIEKLRQCTNRMNKFVASIVTYSAYAHKQWKQNVEYAKHVVEQIKKGEYAIVFKGSNDFIIDLNSRDGFWDTEIAPKEGGSDGKAT